MFNDKQVKTNFEPVYLGVTLDRTLTFKSHLEKLAQKLKTRNNIISKLCGSNWGADADTLRIAGLALVFSTAEYCSPVWLNSSHVDKVDSQLNQTMRFITGTIKSTPLPWLPVLSNIVPPELRRKSMLKKVLDKYQAFDDFGTIFLILLQSGLNLESPSGVKTI